MYPRLVMDISKLKSNVDAVAEITKRHGQMSMMVVTKCLTADEKAVEMLTAHPDVDYLADSRVMNIATYSALAHKNKKKTCLLRIPMHSEIQQVVEHVDLCFVSELSTIELINDEARKAEKVQDILLMIDMGDLREGVFFKNESQIMDIVDAIMHMSYVNLYGIGVNLTCYGAIIPKNENLSGLCEIGQKIENAFGIKLHMISGGNSSSIYLVDKGEMPKGITNLRLGESFILGNDTAYCTKLPGTVDDALILEAQIVELKEKPSLPIGEVGVDAFGEVPHYEDRGIIKRAILAVGKQDTDLGGMIPLDEKIDILGGSSDHTILDVTKSDTEYKVGDIVRFKVEYGAALKLCTSKYVGRAYRY